MKLSLTSGGGSHGVKVTEEHQNFLAFKIEENPSITLNELKDLLMSSFSIKVTLEWVRNHLNALVYTLKDIRFGPGTVNFIVNKEKRKRYVDKFLQLLADECLMLLLYETNFYSQKHHIMYATENIGQREKVPECTILFPDCIFCNKSNRIPVI